MMLQKPQWTCPLGKAFMGNNECFSVPSTAKIKVCDSCRRPQSCKISSKSSSASRRKIRLKLFSVSSTSSSSSSKESLFRYRNHISDPGGGDPYRVLYSAKEMSVFDSLLGILCLSSFPICECFFNVAEAIRPFEYPIVVFEAATAIL